MSGSQYAPVSAADSDYSSDIEYVQYNRRKRGDQMTKMGGVVTKVMSLMGLFGVAYMLVSLLFSLRSYRRPTRPAYPDYYTISNDNDTYAKAHRLSTKFPRESWTMTEDQCDAAFHPLWDPIYDSKATTDRKPGNGHTFEEQERIERYEAGPRELTCVKIVNNALYLTAFAHSAGGSRTESGISLLERAVSTAPEKLPNVQFCLSTQDQPVWGTFSNTRRAGEDAWLVPEFGFWSWPEPGIGSYTGYRQRANAVEHSIGGWNGKIEKLFWRGALWIGEERKVLAEVTKDARWASVHNIDWGGPRSDGVHPDHYETMEGHCKYAFHASPEGLSYSGRLKYLLNCESVIFIRTIEHLVHFSHLLNYTEGELQNVVMIPPYEGQIVDSWRNVEAEVKALLEDQRRAMQIAARSVEVFRDRFLSPAAVACYWRKSIKVWASSQKYNVALDGSEVSWETFTSQFFKMHIAIS